MKKNVLTIDQFLNEQLNGPKLHISDLRHKHNQITKDLRDLWVTIQFNIIYRMRDHQQKTGRSFLRSKDVVLDTSEYLKSSPLNDFYIAVFNDNSDDRFPQQHENFPVYDIEILPNDDIMFYCPGIGSEIEEFTWYEFPEEVSQCLDVLDIIEKYTTVKMNESSLENDSIGYAIGEYLYHVTPEKNLNNILNNGIIPKNGISISGQSYKNRSYFATSLIAAYDISVNFQSWKDTNDNYVIFKINSKCLTSYKNDPLFVHGIYTSQYIDPSCIIEVIEAGDLFGMFSDEDLENLYL